jgi:hypothetical protein
VRDQTTAVPHSRQNRAPLGNGLPHPVQACLGAAPGGSTAGKGAAGTEAAGSAGPAVADATDGEAAGSAGVGLVGSAGVTSDVPHLGQATQARSSMGALQVGQRASAKGSARPQAGQAATSRLM